MIDSKELQIKGKKEVKATGELTHAGPVFIPAVDIPIKICISTTSGIVSICFSGSVVKVQPIIQKRNNGLLTLRTDLFEYLSVKRPHMRRNTR